MRQAPTSSQRNPWSSTNLAQFMNKVYLFMTLGLLITAMVAYYLSTQTQIIAALAQSTGLFIGLIALQLGAVFLFSRSVNQTQSKSAILLFILYSALTGVTFGLIGQMYTSASIGYAFTLSAGSFLGLSIVGFTTKKDLSPIASFCIMGLWGLIIGLVISYFVPSLQTQSMNQVFGAIGVIVFAGLTAYDTQRIKNTARQGETTALAALSGAFMLYLDFINLFISILRLVGDRR